MAIIIPKMFTNDFINDELAKLSDSISSCDSKIVHFTKEAELAHYFYMEADADRKKAYNQLTDPSIYSNIEDVLGTYTTSRNTHSEGRRIALEALKQWEQRKEGYETRKRELEALLPKTEEQRAEEHYQRLLKAKNGALTENECQDLAKQFREMNGYKDTSELAIDCDTQSRKIKERNTEERYQQLLNIKSEASTEEDYQHLVEQFCDMDGYKNTVELAKECENQYRELKEEREREERAEEQRRIEQQLAEEARRKEQERLAAEEQERHKQEMERNKRNRTITNIVLGGVITGVVFAILSVIAKNKISSDDVSSIMWCFAIATGILGFIVGNTGDSLGTGCGYGCGGIIIGAISSLLLAGLFSEGSIIVAICVGVILGALIGLLKDYFARN